MEAAQAIAALVDVTPEALKPVGMLGACVSGDASVVKLCEAENAELDVCEHTALT